LAFPHLLPASHSRIFPFKRATIRNLRRRGAPDPDALLHGSVARFIERPSTWGYLGQLFAIGGWTSLPWLGSLRQPTLVLAGDDDPIVPLVNGRILARCIPNARLHVVDGGGHLFLLEQPARIAAAVAGYLEHAGEGGPVGRTTRGPGPTRDTEEPRGGMRRMRSVDVADLLSRPRSPPAGVPRSRHGRSPVDRFI
jgi:hypothetical protein